MGSIHTRGAFSRSSRKTPSSGYKPWKQTRDWSDNSSAAVWWDSSDDFRLVSESEMFTQRLDIQLLTKFDRQTDRPTDKKTAPPPSSHKSLEQMKTALPPHGSAFQQTGTVFIKLGPDIIPNNVPTKFHHQAVNASNNNKTLAEQYMSPTGSTTYSVRYSVRWRARGMVWVRRIRRDKIRDGGEALSQLPGKKA
ncbi:hypothetical protein DPMN_072617 [Dreissena polymorpha]|uniref:Uncharacterized protein n=1 Tax=Dreissena polymorpha TaxID=45954 RepID=A0A9D4H9P4_DREPO|nr:hypothetical protein DPMN_072617 [Dreissena polymorpha]